MLEAVGAIPRPGQAGQSGSENSGAFPNTGASSAIVDIRLPGSDRDVDFGGYSNAPKYNVLRGGTYCSMLLSIVKFLSRCQSKQFYLCSATHEYMENDKLLEEATIPRPCAVGVERIVGLATWCQGSSQGPVSSSGAEFSG